MRNLTNENMQNGQYFTYNIALQMITIKNLMNNIESSLLESLINVILKIN